MSILKDATEPAAQEKLTAERVRLKTLIEHQLAETAMLAEADEGLGQGMSMVSPHPFLMLPTMLFGAWADGDMSRESTCSTCRPISLGVVAKSLLA